MELPSKALSTRQIVDDTDDPVDDTNGATDQIAKPMMTTTSHPVTPTINKKTRKNAKNEPKEVSPEIKNQTIRTTSPEKKSATATILLRIDDDDQDVDDLATSLVMTKIAMIANAAMMKIAMTAHLDEDAEDIVVEAAVVAATVDGAVAEEAHVDVDLTADVVAVTAATVVVTVLIAVVTVLTAVVTVPTVVVTASQKPTTLKNKLVCM